MQGRNTTIIHSLLQRQNAAELAAAKPSFSEATSCRGSSTHRWQALQVGSDFAHDVQVQTDRRQHSRSLHLHRHLRRCARNRQQWATNTSGRSARIRSKRRSGHHPPEEHPSSASGRDSAAALCSTRGREQHLLTVGDQAAAVHLPQAGGGDGLRGDDVKHLVHRPAPRCAPTAARSGYGFGSIVGSHTPSTVDQTEGTRVACTGLQVKRSRGQYWHPP